MRDVILLALLLATVKSPAWAQTSPPPRVTYVIVHGAWGGSWDWKIVDSLLTELGHLVYRPQLTGLGERIHLASPDIRLATHVDDVVNTIVWEDLRNVVLVGHSYGGMVVTGVADRIPDRIGRLIYLDAFLPDSGQALVDLLEPGSDGWIRSGGTNGFLVPAWADTLVTPRDVPHPVRTLTDTLHLANPARPLIPTVYILTVDPRETPDAFQRFADRAAARGWPVHEMEGDHTPERSAPGQLVELLERVR